SAIEILGFTAANHLPGSPGVQFKSLCCETESERHHTTPHSQPASQPASQTVSKQAGAASRGLRCPLVDTETLTSAGLQRSSPRLRLRLPRKSLRVTLPQEQEGKQSDTEEEEEEEDDDEDRTRRVLQEKNVLSPTLHGPLPGLGRARSAIEILGFTAANHLPGSPVQDFKGAHLGSVSDSQENPSESPCHRNKRENNLTPKKKKKKKTTTKTEHGGERK
ncbi:hypothetical protein CRUP_034805, partial [Coryphaenoides rupestris]